MTNVYHELAEKDDHLRSMYFDNLINLLGRASDLGLSITVQDGNFVVEAGYEYDYFITVPAEYDRTNYNEFLKLVSEVTKREEIREKEEKKNQLRLSAIAKLTGEERIALLGY